MTNAPQIFDALGDPTRRAIFERLRDGPRAVSELAAGLPVTRPAVSQHLRVLKDAGLVLDRAAGTRRYYEARPEAFAAIQAYLDDFWGQSLARFQRAAELEAKKLKQAKEKKR